MCFVCVDWSVGVVVVIGDQWEEVGDKRVGVARWGSGSAPDGAARGGRVTMLGAMMYPGAEDADLEDMRVPPIQLEHLPEVFLCT